MKNAEIRRRQRNFKQTAFVNLCRLMTMSVVLILGVLIYHVIHEGIGWLSWDFLDNFPSRRVSRSGIKPALYGSIYIIVLTFFIAVPLGTATAVFLEEYAPKTRLFRWIEINIANLAGMPSIVYGLLGLAIFVRFFKLDRSLWSGAMTLSLLILPIIIIAARGAIRAVPTTIREGAYAVGARKWHVVLYQVLPSALPGILTGVILAISRAIGETAPLIMIGAASYISYIPTSPNDAFTVLPLQIYSWAARPQAEFHNIAAAAILVLLAVLFTLNLGAIIIRQRFQRYKT